ncbi:63 kda protein [Lasius niger]|uniref:63 kDa protein n=1 Tax=Lasius niger TaxID=67767 RepID=A0A0J7MU68_LASNI|nr:63 kda protein [Lasius niger]
MRAANLRAFVGETGINPGAFDCLVDKRREVRYRAGTAWKPVQRNGQIRIEHLGVDIEIPHQAVQIAILVIQDVMQPVD